MISNEERLKRKYHRIILMCCLIGYSLLLGYVWLSYRDEPKLMWNIFLQLFLMCPGGLVFSFVIYCLLKMFTKKN